MLRGAQALFLGSHTNKIDKKGRIATPAEFRKAIDSEEFNGIVCIPSMDGLWLDCGGLDLLARHQSMIDALDPYNADRQLLELLLMGKARKIGFDSDGRIILPQILRDHANIDDEAAFVGRGSFFQIWHPANLEEQFVHAAELAKQSRFVLKSPSPTRVQNQPLGEGL